MHRSPSGSSELRLEMGGKIFSGQGQDFGSPLISCSDRSPACCHSGPHLFIQDFARGRCLTPFSGPFPNLYVCSDLYPAGKPPSHPKNKRGEEDLQKYIKISSPFTAREKWAHALDLVVSTLKWEWRIVPPRVWNHPSYAIIFKLGLPSLKSAL